MARRIWKAPKLPKTKFNKRVKVVERPLGREHAYGQTWDHDHMDRQPIVEIDPRQPPKEYMDTFIHELLHIADPNMTEDEVLYTANFLTHYLWKYGFRRIHDQK